MFSSLYPKIPLDVIKHMAAYSCGFITRAIDYFTRERERQAAWIVHGALFVDRMIEHWTTFH